MSQYKLIYYDIQGLGEPIRYIFAVAGVEYKDEVIPKSDSTYPKLPADLKESLPWGNLPVLEVDGKRIAQSAAICRFLGKRFNLSGADEFEAAKCDEIADAVKDFGNEWRQLAQITDEAKREEAKKRLTEVTVPLFMKKLNKIAENSGKFYVGKSITWADLYVGHYLTLLLERSKIPFMDAFPAAKKALQNIYEIPQMKEWIAKRPYAE